ncbi:hypothetical protein RO1_38950 [Roseburia intestinalis XB6B4]|uniref:Uncharacterized protein n=1 Tax=Roseburia intestinalis XB6B4 TaxID=718255 RepID=D4L3C6_9FIRM|nr:hypothetical protein RO1_38950 [Roseburia intestinalis XB6B4]
MQHKTKKVAKKYCKEEIYVV